MSASIHSTRVDFKGSQGAILAARLDVPDCAPRAWAVLAHCFTCSKDTKASAFIAAALAEAGYGVLRFDFTGLGGSGGEFSNTHFTSNVDDLVAAADWLRANRGDPALLVGHSLGGAAVLAAAHRIKECRAVATIGAPFDPTHVTHNFGESLELIAAQGEATVTLAGRPFRIKREFLEDLASQAQADRIHALHRPLMVLHAPLDGVVDVGNAKQIFDAALHPKSFVSLDGADHLLNRESDARFAASVIAAWASRYLPGRVTVETLPDAPPPDGVVQITESGNGPFGVTIRTGRHTLLADEPVSAGGADTGPGPYGLLLAALGACTEMTLRMYARQKQWPLSQARVTLSHEKIHAVDCETCETTEGKIDRIEREIELEGALDATQRQRLLEIADKCPVHRTLHSEVEIRTRLRG